MLGWIAIFAAIAAGGTWAARRYALAHSLVDSPGERRSHTVATPRGGGVAIVAAVAVAAFALALRSPGDATLVSAFCIGLAAVAAVGFIDDHRPLSPWLRLSVHVGASALFAAALFIDGSPWQTAVAAFGACVVLVNVWNFMDGINGLAASQAAAIGALLFLVGDGAWAWLALALSAGCLGFLPFNFPRARIFLGDVGSGALGFAVAASLFAARPDTVGHGVLVAMALAPFVIDASLTLGRRVIRGERWWTPHTQHAYQVCARRWGHSRVTLAYGAAAVLPALVWAVLKPNGRFMLAVGAAWYICGALCWLWLQSRGDKPVKMDLADVSDRE